MFQSFRSTRQTAYLDSVLGMYGGLPRADWAGNTNSLTLYSGAQTFPALKSKFFYLYKREQREIIEKSHQTLPKWEDRKQWPPATRKVARLL